MKKNKSLVVGLITAILMTTIGCAGGPEMKEPKKLGEKGSPVTILRRTVQIKTDSQGGATTNVVENFTAMSRAAAQHKQNMAFLEAQKAAATATVTAQPLLYGPAPIPVHGSGHYYRPYGTVITSAGEGGVNVISTR